MASSSSSSYKYDVFLSFRGEDTRDNFTSHLYYALCRKKIQTFIDDEGLKRGDDISPALLNAIECSKISVVIFSKDYASSKWCLNELIKILECHQMNGQIVIPVFYRVDPSDVRKQNGSFGEAFVEHEKHLKDMPEKILKWRAVLTQASNLAGWASKERSEAMLVELIISDILKKLEKVTTSTHLDGFVGLDSQVEEIKSLLCFGSPDIRIIGIWGMGGIGKTTIANVIFNQYSREFEGKCFLLNVREESEKGGLVNLRKRILSEILEERIEVETQILPEYIRKRLRRVKILMVLDDVNTYRQLNYLAQGIDLGPGSRVIITTRDRRVLHNFGVYDTNIYEIRRLNYHDALELFCNCAFKEKCCPSDLLELSESVLKYANGNPLALRVLGSFFHQKSQLDFESSLKYLNQISDPDIYDVLKISYNDLRQEVKSIFLDISCFFIGENRDFVTLLLDGADFGLNILIEKSLVTICESGDIQMHDVLREMGREIVRQECVKEPGKRSRLWYHEDIYRVLMKNKGTDAIEGIFLDLSKIKDIHLASRAFVNMPNLRLLKLYGTGMSSKVHLDQGLEYLPDELRYLHWHNYSLKSLPSNFDPENLIVLNLPYSEVDKIWEGEKEALKLTFMDLYHSRHITKIPGPLEIPKISWLNLSGNNLKSLPASIDCLYSLKVLLLRGNKLESLPETLCSLSLLWHLDLRGNNLESLPESIGCLSSLILLFLNENNLGSLPTSIGCLSSLTSLVLDRNNLKSLPTSIGCLSSLESLNLSGNNLESLPISIGCLSSLNSLHLDGNNLGSLPTSIGCLSSLNLLNLGGNNLKSLPTSIGCLSSLYSFDLGANNLESLPTSIGCLSSLHSLYLTQNDLESLPASIGCLSSLNSLYLSGNKFEVLPTSMKQLSQLQLLNLNDCNKLQSLPELPLSEMTLIAENCKRLQSLTKVPSCPEELDASILETLPRRPSFSSLLDLQFINCPKLNENANNLLEESQQFFQHVVIASLRSVPEPMPYPETDGTDGGSTLCVPGSKIPDWIRYRGSSNSNTIQLPLHCRNRNFIGFVVCVVIGGHDDSYALIRVECDYCFEIMTPRGTQHVQKKCLLFIRRNVFFDWEHILLGFVPSWDVELPDDGDHSTTVSFQFSNFVEKVEKQGPLKGMVHGIQKEIKCCGVSPVYLNANEMKPNSLTLKFGVGSEGGECTEIRNSDDKASTSGGGSDSVSKSDEEDYEPSLKRICREQPNNTP